MDRVEPSKQDDIRTLGEMETYKYLGFLEADSIKHVDMKEKNHGRIALEKQKATLDKTMWQKTY